MQCSLTQDVTILLSSIRRAHFILQAPILSPKCIVKQKFFILLLYLNGLWHRQNLHATHAAEDNYIENDSFRLFTSEDHNILHGRKQL